MPIRAESFPYAERPPQAPRSVHVASLALALLLASASALLPGAAHAWSGNGHRVVGLVAEQHLTGDARRAIRELVGDQHLGEVGLYLDAERDRLRRELPGSDKWHYDNRPVCDPRATSEQWCADGNCASRAYPRWLAVLADRNESRERRTLALRVVVHVLADVHQPLHAGDNGDRGGNDVNVDMGGNAQPRTLHGWWDREAVDRAARGASERAFARRLASERRRDLRRLQSGTFESWMQESYDVARERIYPRMQSFTCGSKSPFVVRLSPEERDAAAEIARERLARAGIRLAGVLNATLGR